MSMSSSTIRTRPPIWSAWESTRRWYPWDSPLRATFSPNLARRGGGAGVERSTMFVRKKRAGAARRGKAASKRKPKANAGLRLPAALEQRHIDVIALFLIAFGVYLVFVLFFGWEGGKVGYGAETALTYLFGNVGARIFTVLLLLVGGMLLTGTSVSDLVKGIGHGLRAIFSGIFTGGDAAARTVAKTHADWREHREARAEAATLAGATDVMST